MNFTNNRKGMSRKGMELQSALVILIIFGIVLILLVVFYKNFLQASSKEMDVAKCQSSLLLTKVVSDKGKAVPMSCTVGSITPFTVDCPRTFVSVNNGVVEKNGKDATSKYNSKCADGTASCLQDNVVATEMAFCWNVFFNGEQPVLQQMESGDLNLFTAKDKKTTCFVCSEITVDSESPKFMEYLSNTKMKDGRTYREYFNNPKAWCDKDYASIGTCWDNMALAKEGRSGIDYSIKPGKYAIAFVRRGLSACDGKTKNTKTEGYLTNSIQLIPADKISSYCGTVMS